MTDEDKPIDAADVAIIGGGISGCAAAYYLARRGVRVVLCEAKEIAAEQSGRAWGYVRRQGRDPAEMPLAVEMMRLWDGLADELGTDLEFTRAGLLTVAETAEDEAPLHEEAAVARAHGIEVRLVTTRQIADIFPGLNGNWRAGLFTPDDGHAEPAKATRAFAAAATRLGVNIRTRTPVRRLDVAAGRACGVITAEGRIRADAVICAAGIDGSTFARTLGLRIPVQVVRASVAETHRAETNLPKTAVQTPGVSIRPTLRGTFYIGNGYRGAGPDYDITLGSLRHLRFFLPALAKNWRSLRIGIGSESFRDAAWRLRALGGAPLAALRGEPPVNHRKILRNERRFQALLPGLAGVGLQRRWAGRIELTPDMIPAIGPIRPVAGVFVATGFSGHGFALGPITGRLLSELVVDGRPSLDLSAFDPHRFEDGRFTAAAEPLYRAVVAAPAIAPSGRLRTTLTGLPG
jgi:glycine/D-amino acid oxidase-like deaminating enzyme